MDNRCDSSSSGERPNGHRQSHRDGDVTQIERRQWPQGPRGGAVQINRVVDTAIAGGSTRRTVPTNPRWQIRPASSTAYRSARLVRLLSRWRVSVLRGVLDRLTLSSMQEQARNNEPITAREAAGH